MRLAFAAIVAAMLPAVLDQTILATALPTIADDLGQITEMVKVLAGAIIVTVGTAVLMSRYLPRMPIFNAMILAPPGTELEAGPRLRPLAESSSGPALVGRRGHTSGPLRPAGKATIDGEYLDVFSEGGFVDAGVDAPIRRIAAEGADDTAPERAARRALRARRMEEASE